MLVADHFDIHHLDELAGSPLITRRPRNLRELHLHNNTLSGSIPPELGDLTNLVELSLWSLNLGNNKLSGSIPPEIGNLTRLGGLWLNANNLSGSIPPKVAALMTGLAVLMLSGNDFADPVPPDRPAP